MTNIFWKRSVHACFGEDEHGSCNFLLVKNKMSDSYGKNRSVSHEKSREMPHLSSIFINISHSHNS